MLGDVREKILVRHFFKVQYLKVSRLAAASQVQCPYLTCFG